MGFDHRRRARPTANAAPIARGAKSGKLRPLPLLYQEIDGKYVVIGSKGGSPTHPGWYVNLKANPKCEIWVGSKRMRARARTASGDERTRDWKKWPRCIRHTTNTRSEQVRGRSRWWFWSQSAPHEHERRALS